MIKGTTGEMVCFLQFASVEYLVVVRARLLNNLFVHGCGLFVAVCSTLGMCLQGYKIPKHFAAALTHIWVFQKVRDISQFIVKLSLTSPAC